ncbi:MAG: hypothetical protein ACREBC_33040, partial [Pyrinomonadaceae bacterium]
FSHVQLFLNFFTVTNFNSRLYRFLDPRIVFIPAKKSVEASDAGKTCRVGIVRTWRRPSRNLAGWFDLEGLLRAATKLRLSFPVTPVCQHRGAVANSVW